MIFRIAFRNVFRHKRRTFLSGITVAFGLIILIIADSLMSGSDRASMENMIDLTDGSIKLFTNQYAEERMAYPLAYGIENIEGLFAALLGIPGVEGVTSRLSFLCEAIAGTKTVRTVGTAVDPETDPHVFKIAGCIKEGRYFRFSGEPEVLLGRKLAQDLGVTVGDSLVLSVRTRQEAHNAMSFDVVGILEAPAPAVNEKGIFISFGAANLLLDTWDLVTEIVLRIPWNRMEDMAAYLQKVNGVKTVINEQFEGLTAYTFYEENLGYLELMAGKSKSQSWISLMVLLITAVGIVNTILMSILERTREIGVLQALGMRPNQIKRMFLYEGMLIGLLGSVAGLVISLIINYQLVESGFDVTASYEGLDASQFPVWGVIYGQWNVKTYLIAFLLGIGIATFAAYLPVRKAVKVKPTECLKFV